jgi:hypothetical protein
MPKRELAGPKRDRDGKSRFFFFKKRGEKAKMSNRIEETALCWPSRYGTLIESARRDVEWLSLLYLK